jgi:hypothetical protein
MYKKIIKNYNSDTTPYFYNLQVYTNNIKLGVFFCKIKVKKYFVCLIIIPPWCTVRGGSGGHRRYSRWSGDNEENVTSIFMLRSEQ